MTGRTKFLFFLLFSVSLVSGCKVKRTLEKSPLMQLNENALLELVSMNAFSYNTLSGKMSVSASTPDQNGSFKVNLRMGKDSAIWMSITPALGIEAVRILIEPDSLKYINKIKNQYFVGDYNSIDSLLQYTTKFEFIENLLVGNAVEIEPSEKYTSIVDNLYYVLQTKVKRKLKKSVNVEIKPNKKDSLYGDILHEKKYKKATEKLDEDDLIVKRYYIRASDFRIARVNIDDLLYQRSVQISYDDFQVYEGMKIPMSINIQVITPTETSRVEMQYSRIKINEPQGYPFKIPSSYRRVD